VHPLGSQAERICALLPWPFDYAPFVLRLRRCAAPLM
jgi:hypothetical protein